MLLTGIFAMLAYNSGFTLSLVGSPLMWVVMLAPLAFVMVLSFGINKLSTGAAQALFWGYAAIMGLSMSTIFLAFTQTSIATTFFATAAAFLGLSLYGYTTKKDLSGFGTFLIMGVVGILVAMLINLFVQSTALNLAISVIGVHACVIGMPVLEEKVANDPRNAIDTSHADARRQAIKSEFTEKRGYWSAIWDGTLALDPDFFEAFTTFSSVPWVHGKLPPKVKEFMYIAVDVSVTHQYVPGTHVHIENALKYGATPAEILEVMQLASTMGIASFELALPIVLDEIAAREAQALVTP